MVGRDADHVYARSEIGWKLVHGSSLGAFAGHHEQDVRDVGDQTREGLHGKAEALPGLQAPDEEDPPSLRKGRRLGVGESPDVDPVRDDAHPIGEVPSGERGGRRGHRHANVETLPHQTQRGGERRERDRSVGIGVERGDHGGPVGAAGRCHRREHPRARREGLVDVEHVGPEHPQLLPDARH